MDLFLFFVLLVMWVFIPKAKRFYLVKESLALTTPLFVKLEMESHIAQGVPIWIPPSFGVSVDCSFISFSDNKWCLKCAYRDHKKKKHFSTISCIFHLYNAIKKKVLDFLRF